MGTGMTREEAIDLLDNLIGMVEDSHNSDYDKALKTAIISLKQESKIGHWISHKEHCENLGVMPSGLGAYKWCSNCDCGIDIKEWHMNYYNYCPTCGAKMVESKEEE